MTENKCPVCNGEKVTDDNEDQSERAPWSFWQALTPPSDMAVRLGLVHPTPCYACQTNQEDWPMSTPITYRKKPVEIEAMQYDGQNTVEVAEWLRGHGVCVGWSNATMVIPTLEGRMEARPGDYIIRGVAGEFYPCKPDIFEQTYERAED